MNNCLSGTMSLGANLLSIFVPSYFLTVTNCIKFMCFRIINHEKTYITKGKGYICNNLKITDNEEIYIIYTYHIYFM